MTTNLSVLDFVCKFWYNFLVRFAEICCNVRWRFRSLHSNSSTPFLSHTSVYSDELYLLLKAFYNVHQPFRATCGCKDRTTQYILSSMRCDVWRYAELLTSTTRSPQVRNMGALKVIGVDFHAMFFYPRVGNCSEPARWGPVGFFRYASLLRYFSKLHCAYMCYWLVQFLLLIGLSHPPSFTMLCSLLVCANVIVHP